MPKWWPGNQEKTGKGATQKRVYDIVKLYGPMSTNEAADRLYEERDKPAGIPFEGKAKYSVRAQAKWTLRRLAGLDRVHDINQGAEGTKPQWAVKLPEKHEPKLVTEEGRAKQARQRQRKVEPADGTIFGDTFSQPQSQEPPQTPQAKQTPKDGTIFGGLFSKEDSGSSSDNAPPPPPQDGTIFGNLFRNDSNDSSDSGDDDTGGGGIFKKQW